MKGFKKKAATLHDNKSRIILLIKSLFLALIISFACIIIYSIILSFTSVSDNTMSIITQAITMVSIVAAALYCGKKVKSKGWLYGMIVGILFVLLMIPISMMWGQTPVFDRYFAAKIIMGSLVGLIGGVIGVNIS
ncbi:MAG: TIGR04086 family membrane protein [Clostridiales bacterium]|nr:TIGR04086 family membrane protein [Clostridiales bacterium]